MSLLGNAMSTDCDYYSTLLGIRIDTDGQVIKMNAQLRIRQLMEERGWTDYRLAKEANLSHSTVTNMFKRNNAPTLPTLEAVCAAFGITLSQFFSEGNNAAEITEEQRALFAKWSTLSDKLFYHHVL